MKKERNKNPVQPVSGTKVPRFAGPSTFARLPELRDVEIQKDRMRFRRNIERIGEIAAYEISKTMEFETKDVVTPLGVAPTPLLKELPVVGTILRAGLPLHQGILNYFDGADNAFVSAYRKHHKDGSFDIRLDYMSSPSLEDNDDEKSPLVDPSSPS